MTAPMRRFAPASLVRRGARTGSGPRSRDSVPGPPDRGQDAAALRRAQREGAGHGLEQLLARARAPDARIEAAQVRPPNPPKPRPVAAPPEPPRHASSQLLSSTGPRAGARAHCALALLLGAEEAFDDGAAIRGRHPRVDGARPPRPPRPRPCRRRGRRFPRRRCRSRRPSRSRRRGCRPLRRRCRGRRPWSRGRRPWSRAPRRETWSAGPPRREAWSAGPPSRRWPRPACRAPRSPDRAHCARRRPDSRATRAGATRSTRRNG